MHDVPDPDHSSLARILPNIRTRFPLAARAADGTPRLYLNSAAGTHMVDTAAEAAEAAGRTLNPMPGKVCPAELETAGFQDRVRRLVADFLNAAGSDEISFHASSTAALFNLAFAMRERVGRRDNVVVTDLDHMANISSWETVLGEGAGCEVRRARVSADGTLDLDYLFRLMDGRTRVLAVTMASNALGSIVPLGEVIPVARLKAPECVVAVDAVHHALHGPIDVRGIDCDALVFSGYKIFGPMLGVLFGKSDLLQRLRPYRVETNRSEPPGNYELGMLNNAALASLEAALEYLLWLGREASGPGASFAGRRENFVFAMRAVAAYEEDLSRRVLEKLRSPAPSGLTLYGLTDPARCAERDPTFAFEVAGQTASETKKRLWDGHRLQIADGNHYSAAVYRHLGKPALCRASFAHYDAAESADRFAAALDDVVRTRTR